MPKINVSNKKKGGMMAFLAALGLKQLAADAEPEELQAAIDAMAEEQSEGSTKPSQDADPAIQSLQEQVAKLTELVTQLANAERKEVSPEDAIDAEIAKLEGEKTADDLGEEEESRTIPAESMDDEGPIEPAEERPKNPLTGDNAAKIAALRAIKPIIAAIPDPAARKQAADAAIASLKSKPTSNTYGKIKPQKPAQDGKSTAAVDHTQLGREIAKKFNPHYKERA